MFPFRIKDSPDDFRVAEVSDFPLTGGPFVVYALRKRNIGTVEALDELRPQLGRCRISFGGLKDKYAVTEQFVAVENGPRRDVRTDVAHLAYLGQAAQAFDSKDIQANRFTVVLRDIEASDADRLQPIMDEAAGWWTPNYFDEQRFGSLGESGVFMAEHWCRGDHEASLRTLLTDPNPHDESADRKEKLLLAEYWNEWSRLPILRDPVRHAVVSHLANRPGDFRGAIVLIPHHERALHLSAFQSAIWNRMLTAEISSRIEEGGLIRFPIADASLAMPNGGEQSEFLDGLSLPFPTARTPLPSGSLGESVTKIMKSYGLEYRQLRVKYPRDTFFSKGDRAAGFQALGLRGELENDDKYHGRRMLTLHFDLLRGCYATMFLRRLATALEASGAA